MRICIPTKTNEGYEAKVVPYVTHVPYLMMYDTELHYLRMVKNKFRHHHIREEEGPRRVMRDCHVQAVISSGIREKALNGLHHMGVKVYRTQDKNVEEVLEHLGKNLAEEIV